MTRPCPTVLGQDGGGPVSVKWVDKGHLGSQLGTSRGGEREGRFIRGDPTPRREGVVVKSGGDGENRREMEEANVH